MSTTQYGGLGYCQGGNGNQRGIGSSPELAFSHPGHQCQTTFTMRPPGSTAEDTPTIWYYCTEMTTLRVNERGYENWLFTPLHPVLYMPTMSMTASEVTEFIKHALERQEQLRPRQLLLPFRSRRVRRNLTMPTNWDE